MSTAIDVSLTVNGERVTRRIEARRHLVDFLRLDLGLMGTHTGCEHGICGACTVRVDGKIVRGCLVLAASLEGVPGRDHRGRLGLGRNPRPAGGVRRPQCLPVRLLHARHADGRRRPARRQQAALARRDPRAPVRQLLPLHRLSRHRRRRRGHRGRAHRKGRVMNEIIDPRSVDRPNSYIGKSVPRPNAKKLVEGRGQYVDDVVLPRMVHVAFVRSPHAHAKIGSIDASAALQMPHVLRVFTGADLAKQCEPWVATLAHLKGMKSAPQLPLPLEHATWVGEAVAAVVAESRAAAEDAVARRPRRLRAAARRGRHGDRAAAIHAGDPPRPRRQPLLPARQRDRQGRRRLRGRAQNRRGHLPQRPPHGPHRRAALDPGRLQPRLRQAHRASLDAGAAHDAGRVRPAAGPARGRRARHLRRCRRQLRHQGARLPRRGGGRRHRPDHGPSRQVHRRPSRELRQRHPRPRPPHQGAHGRRRRRAASPPSTSTISRASAPIRSIPAPARWRATRS